MDSTSTNARQVFDSTKLSATRDDIMPAAIRMSTVFGPSATSEPRMIEPDLNKMIWSRCGMVHLSGVGRGKPIVVLPGLAVTNKLNV